MQFLACDGTLVTGAAGDPACSGSWSAVTASELAVSANGLTASDFGYLAGVFVVWFALAFGVKMIRRVFNL